MQPPQNRIRNLSLWPFPFYWGPVNFTRFCPLRHPVFPCDKCWVLRVIFGKIHWGFHQKICLSPKDHTLKALLYYHGLYQYQLFSRIRTYLLCNLNLINPIYVIMNSPIDRGGKVNLRNSLSLHFPNYDEFTMNIKPFSVFT